MRVFGLVWLGTPDSGSRVQRGRKDGAMQSITVHHLACGATLVLEPMAGVRSAGMTWLLPSGVAAQPADREGLAAILSEALFRGAGDRDSRAHSDALDMLGVSRSSSARTRHLMIGATLLGQRMVDALPLFADMMRRPRFEPDGFEAVRDLCLQSLAGLEDDPQERTMIELRRRHLAAPLNRSSYGDETGLTGATRDDLLAFWRDRVCPRPTIIGVAGDIEPDAVVQTFEQLLADWDGDAPEIETSGSPTRGINHIEDASAQLHIGVAYDAPNDNHPSAMLERVATSVLSGGMSGRLFTEVREKRSLCYTVHAMYAAGRDDGRVLCYAGTTPERAQETLDVMAAELLRMREGVTESEFERAVTGLKSRVVMHGESTSARAAAIASDYFVRGRARTLSQLEAEIDAVTRDAVNDHLARRDFGRMTIATIGPSALEAPDGITV
jgi:predicted Zn-dependent peptidase